jgi:hypothetical protein
MIFKRKTKKEIESEIEQKRPEEKTFLKRSFEMEFCWGISGRKKETIKSIEVLKWILSYQNPFCLKEIKLKYKNILIEGLGSSIQVKEIK